MSHPCSVYKATNARCKLRTSLESLEDRRMMAVTRLVDDSFGCPTA